MQLLFREILIQKQDAEELLNILSDSCIEQIVVETYQSSVLVTSFNSFYSLPKKELLKQVDQLYIKAVGEMQISPVVFWDMTPKEIELAYIGYLKRMELGTNCILAAIRRSKTSNDQLISLLKGQEFNLSTLEEREKTFKTLNIS